jgi:hypothetical protein
MYMSFSMSTRNVRQEFRRVNENYSYREIKATRVLAAGQEHGQEQVVCPVAVEAHATLSATQQLFLFICHLLFSFVIGR